MAKQTRFPSPSLFILLIINTSEASHLSFRTEYCCLKCIFNFELSFREYAQIPPYQASLVVFIKEAHRLINNF